MTSFWNGFLCKKFELEGRSFKSLVNLWFEKIFKGRERQQRKKYNYAMLWEKTCGIDGPDNCGDHFKGEVPYTAQGAETVCSDCGVAQCCVAPVIQETCVNQHVACSGHFDKHENFMTKTCQNCVHNGEECCTARTCANQGVTCNADVFLKVEDYDEKLCLGCVNNELECCTPKMCGAHFFDTESECPAETHTAKRRNKPCVNCGQKECCKPLPTLKCAEIIIPHGQAFYSTPTGAGSERTKGSILSVECDLGYKFQDAEYGNFLFCFLYWLCRNLLL